MNRLIIIGNGFDLAHGLKTRFSDFLNYYLVQLWPKLQNPKNQKDLLVNFQRTDTFFRENDVNFNTKTALSIIKKLYNPGKARFSGDPVFGIHSSYFEQSFKNYINGKWLDLETEYFHELMRIIEQWERKFNQHGDRKQIQNHKLEDIQKLNKQIDLIGDLLIEHIDSEEKEFYKNPFYSKDLSDCFYENIYNGESDKIEEKDFSLVPNKILIVNFNYTNTAKSYVGYNAEYIHIHGNLSDEIIFGFGDDTSDKYKELENEYNNEFLRKIKSFRYLKNSNYKKLVTFIISGEFQVHIYGHSCGVSDRTLFKQIFENKYCKHIKTFYYDQKDFDEKMFEISRHFEDKNMFLEKVVPFNDCRPMPQPKENK